MIFPSIRIEGAILSGDLLSRLDSGDFKGQKPADFGVASAAQLKDEIVRAWTHAQAYYRAFREKVEGLKPEATGTTETRSLFIIPLLALLGYQDLEFSKAEVVGDKSFPISHRLPGRDGFAVHIVGARESLDKKPSSGAGARCSPHALVQEYLNLTEHLYGIVTNGRLLRLLRDSTRLIKLSYVEFDLDRIFTEELFSDFAVLYRLLHVTRLPQSAAEASKSLLERYHQDALESGARIRDGLSVAVEQAIQELGTGFLARTPALQTAVTDGTLNARDHYYAILRLIYRVLFLMVAEERGLIFPAGIELHRRRIYEQFYSMDRLRRLAERPALADAAKADLWQSLLSTFRLFEIEGAGNPLGITALCGHLFSPAALGSLGSATVDNGTLLSALGRLSIFRQPDTGHRVRVNYGALATEEFGSVYERLLELHPLFVAGAVPGFAFKSAAGNERKTTGSYYTPSSLVECLLDSALDPVLDERLIGKSGKEAEEAILSLKVCDPACGSGHFLLAAAQRLARRLAQIRAGGEEPSPEQLRTALRQVISRCLYGVDINPMSVELCKITLWIEATEPGKPLSFLDHHIQCGNSLLGVTPRLLKEGLPDDAFKPLTGDDPAVCREAKRRNKDERKQLALFHGEEAAPWERLGNLPMAMHEVEAMSDDTTDALHKKEERYAQLVRSTSYLNSRFLADAWCAAFVWKKTKDFGYPITNDVLRRIERNPHDCAPWMRTEVERLRDEYQFFHWHLAFPEVFPAPQKLEQPVNAHAGWNGGFDVLLGNPPWERVKLQEKEWFAEILPEIANAPNAAARKRLIQQLREQSPQIFAAFAEDARKAEGEAQIMRSDELYPLCGCGDMNTYALFAERSYYVVSRRGYFGLVLPTGIVTGDNTKAFFGELMRSSRLRAFIGFDNEEKQIFPDIDNNLTFAAVVVGPDAGTKPKFCFNIRRFEQLKEADRFFELSDEDLSLLNPNTRTCPLFRSSADGELVRRIYADLPLVWLEVPREVNTWGIRFMTMFHMAGDSDAFVREEQLISEGASRTLNRFVLGAETFRPLYEAKMIWHFEHRWAAFYGREMFDGRPSRKYVGWYGVRYEQPDDLAFGRYWVADTAIRERIGTDVRYFAAFRDITNRDLERTTVFTILPAVAVGHQAPMVFLPGKSAIELACFVAERNCFAADFVSRNKIDGSHLTYFVFKQLPVLPPTTYVEPCNWSSGPGETIRDWLLPRVLELTYTAWDLEPFARDCGWFGPPFVWNEARRFQLRCELDAAFFHLYGLNRDDAAYIMDTFPIVRRKDEAAHGTYRTKNRILEIYDELSLCAVEGRAFTNPELGHSPADPHVAHEPRLPAMLRPAFKSPDYFPHILPLIARLQTQGVEAGRFLHALEILTEPVPRRAALNGCDIGAWRQWADGFPKSYAFSDAAAALQVLLGEGTLKRWQDHICAAPDTAFVDDEWLNTDAFIALRLALAAPAETVQRSRAATEERFPALMKLLLAA